MHEIYKIYVSVGSAGTLWEDSAGCAATAEQLFIRRLRGGSEKRMQTSVQVLRRCHSWAKAEKKELIEAGHPAEELDILRPSPNFMGKFLLSVVPGGPTAAAQAWAHLDWWRAKVGLPFPTHSTILTSFRSNEPGHRIRQALELPAWVFLNLVLMAKMTQGPESIMIKIILFTTMSCIRWEHVQARYDAGALWGRSALAGHGLHLISRRPRGSRRGKTR